MNIKACVVRPLNVVYNGPILMGQILCTRRINALHFLTSVRVCLTYSGDYTQRGGGGWHMRPCDSSRYHCGLIIAPAMIPPLNALLVCLLFSSILKHGPGLKLQWDMFKKLILYTFFYCLVLSWWTGKSHTLFVIRGEIRLASCLEDVKTTMSLIKNPKTSRSQRLSTHQGTHLPSRSLSHSRCFQSFTCHITSS